MGFPCPGLQGKNAYREDFPQAVSVPARGSSPLRELLGEGAVVAAGEILEAEIVVELQQCLLM